MKAVLVAAAVMAGGVSAGHVGNVANHWKAHEEFKAAKRGGYFENETCVPTCTTIYSVITGSPGLYTPPTPPSTYALSTPSSPPSPASSTPAVVPTPIPHTCPTPGTYTFPATTVVVTESTTVYAASTTEVPSGTYTIGGITTVVETPTTIVVPYATTKTETEVVTTVVETTTYVCPTPGTYTIAPFTTTVTVSETVVVVPVITSYAPGTYTAPAVVTTVTETDVVVYCPFSTPTPTAYAAAPPAASPAAAGHPKPHKAKPTPHAATSAPSSSYPGTSPSLGGSAGDHWAITYTPYTESGQCKSAGQVAQDLRLVKNAGFTTVRVYSTDCNTLPNVGAAARAVGLKMILGIFIGEVGCDNGSPHVADQLAAIKQWRQWDLVELIVVGNESIFNKFCSVSQLRDLIVHVKTTLAQVGYTGPYTTTDVVSAWLDYDVKPICEVIDVVGTNAHAYFNAATEPQNAGEFVAGQLRIVENVCNKPGYVLESGWPSAGKCFGKACAGRSQQAAAIASIKKSVGKKVVFFSFGDDHWKAPGDCQCEQHWGCGSLFGV
ncbi:hypothetical protein VTK73DRAFT_6218 [Phialemonium thermophilum]|uniref:Probable beta-glucosidase btgE n=1 Tax=Phialemonium thermophilum TaxID=223376 RepID=A0ABR3XW20_9PEZI